MLQWNPRRADAGHPTIPMHRPEAPRFAPTTPPPDEALMVDLAAEFRQPLAHGVFSPPPRDHPRLHRSVGGSSCGQRYGRGHTGASREGGTPVESSERAHGVASEKKSPTCSVGPARARLGGPT